MDSDKELSFEVSERFFENHSTTTVTCPHCNKTTKVLVSIMSIEHCHECGRMFTVSFNIRDDD